MKVKQKGCLLLNEHEINQIIYTALGFSIHHKMERLMFSLLHDGAETHIEKENFDCESFEHVLLMTGYRFSAPYSRISFNEILQAISQPIFYKIIA